MAAEPAISKNATAEWRDSARNADWKICVACRPHPEPAVLPDSNVFETQLAAPLSTPLSTRLALATLRRARDSDANALSALMRDTFRDAYGHCSSPANVARFLDAHYRPALQQREIADSGIDTLLAETGDGLQGFLQLRWGVASPRSDWRNAVELGRLYLSRRWHGTGLAACLLDAAQMTARARSADGMWLKVWKQAPQAIRFYTKHGFHVAGTARFDVGMDVAENWVMYRHLDAKE